MSIERVIIPIPGRIYSEILDQVKTDHEHLISKEGADYLLDCTGVDNLYSSVISLILHIRTLALKRNGKTYLVNLAGHLRQALHAMKIDTIIPVYPTMLDFELQHDTPTSSQ